MKDLTEAELIEMERRAFNLMNDLEEDPDKLKKSEIVEAWEDRREKLNQVAQDVETLCEHLRAKASR